MVGGKNKPKKIQNKRKIIMDWISILLKVCSLMLFLFLSVAVMVNDAIGNFLPAGTMSNTSRIFLVVDYGAVADGKTDNAQAFLRAWKEACASKGDSSFLIPEGSFLAGPVKFEGPCNGYMTVEVKGTVLAPTDLSYFSKEDWINFQYIDGMSINGGGVFDGQGASAWPHNQCQLDADIKSCGLPMSLTFSFVNNTIIQKISSVDSKNFHFQIFSCNNVIFDSLRITAPGDSPNTDGMHLGLSSNISIGNSIIGTGDDCISIGPGNTNISIFAVFCGPGHGISVGSLGRDRDERSVTGAYVNNCTLTNTTNGIRIKTWQNSPSTSQASYFNFTNIEMQNVYNPIFIDQSYCPYKSCNQESPSLVKISNIRYENIRGNTMTKVAVNLLCSKAMPCEDIMLKDINLKYNHGGKEAVASCTNANGNSSGVSIPPSCL